MLISKPKFRPQTKNIYFRAKNFDIRPVSSLKVLGCYISYDLSNDREISQLLPLLNNRINQLEKLKVHTDFETRRQFSNAYIIGRLLYMMPTYTNINQGQWDELHKILMHTAMNILNS